MSRLEDMLSSSTPIRGIGHIIPRVWAGDVLSTVGSLGSAGHFPDDVTPEEIGWALVRVLVNCHPLFEEPDTDAVFQRVIQGFEDAREWLATGYRPELVE